MEGTSTDTVSELDRRIVAGQIGREPRALAGVAVRCVYGMPAVTSQAKVDENGKPFPTACYLTCPHLVKQVDRLESTGGVRRFEALMQQDPELKAATLAASARHAAERGIAIAAASDPERLKCLHAHAAWALARGDHPLGSDVVRAAAPRWCDDARCRAFATD